MYSVYSLEQEAMKRQIIVKSTITHKYIYVRLGWSAVSLLKRKAHTTIVITPMFLMQLFALLDG